METQATRSVQEIFDVVITAEEYLPGINFMCSALRNASRKGIITDAEFVFTTTKINNYVSSYRTLANALYRNRLPCTFTDRLAIYKDWTNRPTLTY